MDALDSRGFDAIEAADGDTGLQKAVKVDYDLLLLDLVLPGRDGMDILERVRADRPTLPVIILTAKGGESDRVKGLRLGADDYVVKPFSYKELLARIDAVLRRSPERPGDVSVVGLPHGTVDLARREVRLSSGTRSELSEREAEIVRYLAQNAGRAVSRDEILARVWRIDAGRVYTRTIDMHVARLREKLGDDSADPQIILTVRGKGYMWSDAQESG